MILLQANRVSRKFADVTLYDSVNFSIQNGDRIALVGRNGTGKSTLLKQILGQEPINDGEFTRSKNLKIGYLEQHVAVDSDLSIWQEMLSLFQDKLALRKKALDLADRLAQFAQEGSIDHPHYQETLQAYDEIQVQLEKEKVYQIESDIRTVLHGFQFFPEDFDRGVQSLSGGQKTRLALAKLLLQKYDLLILDEPTNHLDMQTLNWLEKFLANYKGALLIVSHDRYFLDKVVNQVFELRDHTLHSYTGNYSAYVIEKNKRLELAKKAYLKQQVEIHRLEDFVQKNIARASTTKRAQSRRKQLEKINRIQAPKQDEKAPRIQFSSQRESGEKVIQIQDLNIGYDQPLCQGINFDLIKQDSIAIVGPNGIGKTTLLKTLLNELPALGGDFRIGSQVTVGYYDQNVSHLNENTTVLETLWQAHDNLDEWKIRSILGSFLFSGETVEKKVKLLSGGEKARLSLALLAANQDNTLLLDEPTNHLDIDSKEVLEEALINFNGSLLFVSHDRYFINRVANKIIELSPKGSQLYLGDYDYYLAKKEELQALQEASQEQANNQESISTPSVGQLSYEENKRVKSDIRKLQKSVDQIWQSYEEVENQIQKVKQLMLEVSQDNDHQELIKLDQDLKKLNETSQAYINQWEEEAQELEELLQNYPDLA